MSAISQLKTSIEKSGSMLCLGLDLDHKKMPGDMGQTLKGIFEFAHRIIDASSDLVCAYKPNLAFFEQHGAEGVSLLRLLVERIPEHIPVILDGKRGDIANTSSHYARFLFDYLGGHWTTINPWMGFDSVQPFLDTKDRGSFVLCLTSNPGSKDFQQLDVNGKPLYEIVAEKVNSWNKHDNCGLVVGATHLDQLRSIRAIAPTLPILIPGVGAQGGSLEEAASIGTDNFTKPALINVSRSVLYASHDKDYAQRARQELESLKGQIDRLRGVKPVAAVPIGNQVSE